MLIVDTYTQFRDPVAVLRNAGKALGPTGRLGIVDFKRDGSGGPGPRLEERIAPEAIEADADGGRPQALQPGDVPSISILAGFHTMRTPLSSPPPFFGPHFDRVGRALQEFLPSDSTEVVVDCMRYTLLAPSKRVRAVLVLLTAELCGNVSRAMPAACAIEAVHAASLMLDDLPCMDNAPLRRGRPSSHLTYGEAVTILAAFGLLNQAFGHLAKSYEPPLAMRLTSLMSDAVGLDGLVGGQAEDVLATERALSFETLERIHRRKTGVFFSAAAAAGVLTAGGSSADLSALTNYAKNLGLAFQIVDDLLDVTGTTAETGKAVRTDVRKTTFVSFSGVDGARQLANELCATATTALEPFGARANSTGGAGEVRRRAEAVSGRPAGSASRRAARTAARARLPRRARGSLRARRGRAARAGRSRSRRPRAFASASSPARCSGPAAAIGLRARSPGLVTSTTDAVVLAGYLALLFGLAAGCLRVHLDSHRRSGRSRADAHAGVRRSARGAPRRSRVCS